MRQRKHHCRSTTGYTHVLGDVKGERVADFEIRLAWVDPLTPLTVTAADFFLKVWDFRLGPFRAISGFLQDGPGRRDA